MSRTYRMPDGEETTDPDKYGNAWIDLAKKVEPYFPGYVPTSFNPNIEFTCHQPRPYASRFTLTVDQINLLLASATPNTPKGE